MAWRNRNKDNAPVSHTCPMIDGVLSAIHSLYQSSEEMTKSELKYFEDTMEKIRSHNGSLRDWGNEQCNMALDYEDEIDELKRTVDKQSEEISRLKDEVRELENNLVN